MYQLQEQTWYLAIRACLGLSGVCFKANMSILTPVPVIKSGAKYWTSDNCVSPHNTCHF